MIADAIKFLMMNFTLTFLAIGLVVALIALVWAGPPVSSALVVDAFLRAYLFFVIGVTFLYNFVVHTVFSTISAHFIGWADSPFQLEVGYASLGFAVLGFLGVWRSFDMRLAAILGTGIFLWGAAGGHVYQMVTEHNFAPGNAGIIFYTDIGVPLLGFILLWLQRRFTLH